MNLLNDGLTRLDCWSCAAILILGPNSIFAQEGGIEIFAGETLFEQGWRLSVTEIYKLKRDLYSGSHRVSDPLNCSTTEWESE